MNRKLFHHLLEPGGLYAPQIDQSTGENILCAEGIGISCVITGKTQKLLSSSIFFRHRTASETGTRGVSRINLNKQNTVLLGFMFDPGEYPASVSTAPQLYETICPCPNFHVSYHGGLQRRSL